MTTKRLFACTALIAGILGSIQAQAEEAHLITSLGKPSPEYTAAVEELNAKFDEFEARCSEDASACDYWASMDPYFQRLDAILKENPNRARVTVRGLEEPTTLVLSSPMPIVWRVRGAGIKKIILVGTGKARVKLSEALEDVEVQDLSEQSMIGAFGDDRRRPVAYSEFDFESGKQYCLQEVDESFAEIYSSELNRSVEGLKQLGLELASAQSDSFEDQPSARFRVSPKTKGILLSESLVGYLCYQESDGSIIDGETLLMRRSE